MFCGGLHEFLVQLIKFLFVTLSLPSMSIMLKLGPNASCLSLSENDNRRENNWQNRDYFSLLTLGTTAEVEAKKWQLSFFF